jgi:propanediol dehydratase small subunit
MKLVNKNKRGNTMEETTRYFLVEGDQIMDEVWLTPEGYEKAKEVEKDSNGTIYYVPAMEETTLYSLVEGDQIMDEVWLTPEGYEKAKEVEKDSNGTIYYVPAI